MIHDRIASHPEPQRDGRGALRIPVRLKSTICSSAVRKVKADLVDLSTGGCRLATGLYMSDGAHLTLAIPTLEPVGARVRWCHHLGMGLEFLRPLHPLIVQRLAGLSMAALH
ncbi:PilZ domain-containing protein [Sphingomonas sp. Leaf343]|uniref:PilZ domain-containing protein n=1 Tax=Sphingomonas sp. Leaf343 TaxID=1736345 RepID=UPI0006FA1474|nr:PilZ domain-containing protein [Sphingomonas sp. Leaf343]KQR87830.1 hypothetical protein ASG07_02900 [Sphingomonas sp. Leaf343]